MTDIEAMAREVADDEWGISGNSKNEEAIRSLPTWQNAYRISLEMAKRLSQECVIVPKEPSSVVIDNMYDVLVDRCGIELSRLSTLPLMYKAMIATVENKDG